MTITFADSNDTWETGRLLKTVNVTAIYRFVVHEISEYFAGDIRWLARLPRHGAFDLRLSVIRCCVTKWRPWASSSSEPVWWLLLLEQGRVEEASADLVHELHQLPLPLHLVQVGDVVLLLLLLSPEEVRLRCLRRLFHPERPSIDDARKIVKTLDPSPLYLLLGESPALSPHCGPVIVAWSARSVQISGLVKNRSKPVLDLSFENLIKFPCWKWYIKAKL